MSTVEFDLLASRRLYWLLRMLENGRAVGDPHLIETDKEQYWVVTRLGFGPLSLRVELWVNGSSRSLEDIQRIGVDGDFARSWPRWCTPRTVLEFSPRFGRNDHCRLSCCQKWWSMTFEDRVTGVLAGVFDGMHHIQREWARAKKAAIADEKHPWCAIVVRDSTMQTYDYDGLTRLVVLAHDACLRVELSAKSSRGYVELAFHPRRRDGDAFHNRHPTLEAAADRIRATMADLRPQEER